MIIIIGTLIVVMLMFNGISGDQNCGENCQWTSWYDWNCGYCCNTVGFNQAIRNRGICCDTSSDILWCLNSCNEDRISLQDTGACPNHCPPCPTTTTKSTTMLFLSTSHIHARTRMTNIPVFLADISTTVLQTQSKLPAIGATTIGELPSTESIVLQGIASDSPPSIDTGTTLSTFSTESKVLPGLTSDSQPSIDTGTTLSTSSTEPIVLQGITSDSPQYIDTGTTLSTSSTESILLPGITRDSPQYIDTGTTLSTLKTTELDLATHTKGQSTKNLPLSTGLVMFNPPPSANKGNTGGNVTSMPTTASHDYSNETSTETSTTSSEIDLSDSTSTILSSGMSSMNQMISSSTEDCRAECAGKVSRDSCLIECISRPCFNMLTLVTPCLFLLGVIVGSSVTYCINYIIMRKQRKKVENSVWPFNGYN